VFGYATSGDLGVDFHISKISYSAADDKFFDSLISGLHLIQDYKPDSATEFGYGSIYYLHQDWTKAALHYERSLQLERQKRALSQTQWNVLVDNLGMAYGMSGEIPKAKATFEYGTQENPTYPMFRYNLACADSETGDLDGALDQLKLAFQYKSNSNPNESVPDPAKDDSFKRYLSDPRFTTLTKELCPNSVRTRDGWVCR
jgi:tetratricopeptide (TPR) repeat protein